MSAARLGRAAIKIPTRIERGPTDILRALAGTVKFVPNQPEFNLQEDSFLIPQRPFEKKLYLLSKLSGRKTAKYLLNKNPELFFRDDAEPKIEAFLPPEEFRMDMELNEEDIRWCIDNNDVENAKIAYNSLVEKGTTISDALLLDLLEFFCFSEEEKLLDNISIEYERMSDSRNLVKTTWNTNGIAVKIFNDIKGRLNTPRVYSAMIAGLSRANEHAACNQVFQDFMELEPKKGLYPVAYAHLLNSGIKLNSSIDTMYKYIDKITKHMEAHLVKPDLQVFNAILKCYKFYNCDSETLKRGCKLLNDMVALEIKPSLATYIHFMKIVGKTGRKSPDVGLFYDTLTHIENNPDLFVVRDSEDIDFFVDTMYTFSFATTNMALPNRLYKLFTKYPGFFPHARAKGRFLDEYFKLLITTDTIERILKFYDDHIPLEMLPKSETYDALAEALDLYQVDKTIIKRIGDDIINFHLAKSLKNDEIFRRDPSYVEALQKLKQN